MKAANLQFTGVMKSDVHVCQNRQRTMRKAGSEQENREWGTWGDPGSRSTSAGSRWSVLAGCSCVGAAAGSS